MTERRETKLDWRKVAAWIVALLFCLIVWAAVAAAIANAAPRNVCHPVRGRVVDCTRCHWTGKRYDCVVYSPYRGAASAGSALLELAPVTIAQAKRAIWTDGRFPGEQITCQQAGQAQQCTTTATVEYQDVLGPALDVGTTGVSVTRGPRGLVVRIVAPDSTGIWGVGS